MSNIILETQFLNKNVFLAYILEDWVGDALRYDLLSPLAWLEHVKHASSSSGAYTTDSVNPLVRKV